MFGSYRCAEVMTKLCLLPCVWIGVCVWFSSFSVPVVSDIFEF